MSVLVVLSPSVQPQPHLFYQLSTTDEQVFMADVVCRLVATPLFIHTCNTERLAEVSAQVTDEINRSD